MIYEIRKPFLGLFGKPKLVYCCEACGVTLESPLIEAGTSQACPQCGVKYVAPGVREAELQREADEKIRAANALAAVAKAQRAAADAAMPLPVPPGQTEQKKCFSKVAGTNQLNRDGTSRQRILEKCRRGERLILTREPQNSHDRNAIGIHRKNGAQLGYVTAHLAETIAPAMDAGGTAWATIHELTGGNAQGMTRGANLEVWWQE